MDQPIAGVQFDGHEVRLFPSIRISSTQEAEQRATCALLAMVRAVSEFGRSFVKMAGGPAGKLACYTEVPFRLGEREVRPDGVVHATRGSTSWKALVEVKVGDRPLEQLQFDDYLLLAKEHGFDALVTVSNQAAQANGLPPLQVDGRRLRSLEVAHFSWDRLLSEAKVLSRREGVKDQDQQWMLEEWITYVADPSSRIIEPPTLGDHWSEILQAARERNLVSVAKHLEELADLWDGFLVKAALRLRAKLGVEVQPRISRAERADRATRIRRLVAETQSDDHLDGAFRVPDAAGDIAVEVLLAGRAVRYSVGLEPPNDGRAQTRVNWLLRQLRSLEPPPDLLFKVTWDRGKQQSQARVVEALADASALHRDGHGQPVATDAFPKLFSLEWTRPLSKGRGRSTAPILEDVLQNLERFYKQVVEGLRPYVPSAPKLEADDYSPRPAPVKAVQSASADVAAKEDEGEPAPGEAPLGPPPESPPRSDAD